MNTSYLWGIRVLGELGKIMKLVIFLLIPIHLFSSFFFFFFFFFGCSGWKRNERQKRHRDIFKLNFYSHGEKCVSSKIVVLPVKESIEIWEGVSFWCQEAHLFWDTLIALLVGGLPGDCYFLYLFILSCAFSFLFLCYLGFLFIIQSPKISLSFITHYIWQRDLFVAKKLGVLHYMKSFITRVYIVRVYYKNNFLYI